MNGGFCKQDGERTRLTCARCSEPICPRCLVRTPVGMKCYRCAGHATGPAPARRSRWLAVAAMAAGLAIAVVVLPRLGSEPVDGIGDMGGRVRIGEAVNDDDLMMVVASFECGATWVDGRSAQGKFCFLTVGLRNVGHVPATFVASAQMLADPSARRFGPDPSATAAHPSNAGRDFETVVVNPGNEVSGVLVYDVPPDVTPTGAALRAHPGGAGAVVSLTARI